MGILIQTQVKPAPILAPSRLVPSFALTRGEVLQPKWPVARAVSLAAEREEDPGKGLVLQRRATNQAEPAAVPPIVHEVLRSPAQPLDSDTRASIEPRFGHDFSRVQVHTAAPMGIQTKLAVGQPGDKYEREADRLAEQVVRMPEPRMQCHGRPEKEEEGEDTLQTKSASIIQKTNNESYPYCSTEPAMRALEVAYIEYQKGVVEDPPCTNRGNEVDTYTGVSGSPPLIRGNRVTSGTCGRPWCAYFVRWCLNQAGVSNGVTAAARSVRDWGRRRGWYHDINTVAPISGDIFFKVPSPSSSTHPCDTNPCVNRGPGTGHVGFILSVSGNSVTTVEGNVHIDPSNDGLASKLRSISELDGVLRIQPSTP